MIILRNKRSRGRIVIWQITASYFCAGFITYRGKCIRAAPIIRWTIGKTHQYIANYCMIRKWKLEEVTRHDR